jgi:large subunit ribosomal protein L19
MSTTTVISPVNVEARRAADVRVGDTVKVHLKIEDKGKTRIQIFEGLVIARKHGAEAGGTFTVRRTSGGYGVEKIFPLYSPMIDKIEVAGRSRVKRSKLYYIRDKATRVINRQMRNRVAVPEAIDETMPEEPAADESTADETPAEETAEAKA